MQESDVPEELREQLPGAPAKEEKGEKKAEKAEKKAVPKAKAGQACQMPCGAKEKKSKAEELRVGESRVRVGQDAEDNWNILSAAKGKHWFFHLTDHPSCCLVTAAQALGVQAT